MLMGEGEGRRSETSEHDDLRRQLTEARRETVYGVARVASSFANDLAEAREALRVLITALDSHVWRHGDPDGQLTAALAAVRPRALGQRR
jgi:hypothetical protein